MFDQTKLAKSVNQSRGIYDTFIYRSDADSKATVQGAGYFLASRFSDTGSTPDGGWDGAKLEAKCSDGYFEGFIDGATGTVTAELSS